MPGYLSSTSSDYSIPRSWSLVIANFICCVIYAILTCDCTSVVPMVHMYCVLLNIITCCLVGQLLGICLYKGDSAIIIFCLFMIMMHSL